MAAVAGYEACTLAIAIPIVLIFRLNRPVWRFTSLGDILNVAGAVMTIAILAAVLAHFTGAMSGLPRLMLLLQAQLMLSTLGGARVAMRIRHDRRRQARQSRVRIGSAPENVLIVGPLTDLFIHSATTGSNASINIVGILSNIERHHGRLLRSRKILGPPDAICEALHDLSVHGIFVDRVVMAFPLEYLPKNTQKLLLELEKSGSIRLEYLSAPSDRRDASGRREFGFGGNCGPAEPLPNPYLRWKRLIDASVALLCIICFAVPMLIVFLAVLLDVGFPVIFWQQRPGALGRPIKVLKFRTMGPARDREGRTLTDDQRVSNMGRVLRRLRLDELPQVYNVLLGHMSLVGPRPLLPVDQPSAPSARLRLRPGLTGWAQIKGGRHISSEDKAALDLWYIKNASCALDLKILAHTVRMVLFGERVDRTAIRQAWQALQNDPIAPMPVERPGSNPI
ncbi:MAG: sugar transferase [Hyphomicrobium sp.]|uniref:sugar transferase n=1 Tax=Hyphomicrobium sp. TaxID=82 RepID=UPI0039E576D8